MVLRSISAPARTRSAEALPEALSEALDALVAGDAGPIDALAATLRDGGLGSASERDQLIALLILADCWMAPLTALGGREVAQQRPSALTVKQLLEDAFLDRLAVRDEELARTLGPTLDATTCDPGQAAVAAMRRIAAVDLVHPVYAWLAADASWDEVVTFLALEGGPDGGFDDLVALAQVGIVGAPKVVLGSNYWDEMGRGELDEVHTILHDRLVAAIDMPRVPREQQPVGALERAALGGVLATSRRWQPELIGALGLLELQAGPRCRQVLRAFERLGAPADAVPFYAEHAQTDPRHGKEWVDGVVAPLARQDGWCERLVRGARLRSVANARFFDEALVLMTAQRRSDAA